MLKHFSDVSWIILGRLIGVLGALASIRLLTEFLSPSQYGELAIAMTGFSLLNLVIMGPLGQAIGRFYPLAAEQGHLADFFYITLKYLKFTAFGMCALCFLAILFTGSIYKADNSNILILLCLYSYIYGVNDLTNGMQNLAGNRRIVTMNVAIEFSTKLFFIFILLQNFEHKPETVLIALILSSFLSVSHQYLNIKMLNKITKIEESKKITWQTEILPLAYKISSWGPVVWIQQSSDRWALNFFSSYDDVGLYATLSQISYAPMVMIGGIINTFLVPYIYGNRNNIGDKNLTKLLLIFILFGFFISAISEKFLINYIFEHLVSNSFIGITKYIPEMIFAGTLFAAGEFIALRLMGGMMFRYLLIIKIISSILGVIFNIIGAKFYGLQGVVYSITIFSALYFVLALIVFNFMNKKKING